MARPVSVLVVDDSALMRNLITRAFEGVPDVVVADKAFNGSFALKKLERDREIDVITLDLEMPEMNGIEFLEERRRRGIEIPVVILSSLAKKGAEITMQALALGASDFVLKPDERASLKEATGQLVDLVRVYGRRYQEKRGVIPHAEAATALREEAVPAPSRKLTPRKSPGPVELVAIGISTGGPNALREVLPLVDSGVQAPIVVVQHMPAGFTGEFAASLDRLCKLEVKEAADGDLLKPGRVLIAPGNRHLRIGAERLATVVRLSDEAPVNGHRPSVGVLFDSVAAVYQNRCLAAIMTGMGRDGSREIGRIYEEGGLTLAQEESSCVVFGMPRAAIELGAIHEVLTPVQIAARINELTTS